MTSNLEEKAVKAMGISVAVISTLALIGHVSSIPYSFSYKDVNKDGVNEIVVKTLANKRTFYKTENPCHGRDVYATQDSSSKTNDELEVYSHNKIVFDGRWVMLNGKFIKNNIVPSYNRIASDSIDGEVEK